MNAVKHDTISAADMVNLARYPIAELNSIESRAFAEQCRKQYLDTGLCMLTEFINADR